MNLPISGDEHKAIYFYPRGGPPNPIAMFLLTSRQSPPKGNSQSRQSGANRRGDSRGPSQELQEQQAEGNTEGEQQEFLITTHPRLIHTLPGVEHPFCPNPAMFRLDGPNLSCRLKLWMHGGNRPEPRHERGRVRQNDRGDSRFLGAPPWGLPSFGTPKEKNLEPPMPGRMSRDGSEGYCIDHKAASGRIRRRRRGAYPPKTSGRC